MKILLLSDIHGNFPALEAISRNFKDIAFDAICNCGDSTVYGPFPNETLHWLEEQKVFSILGNTDQKIKKLLLGKNFKKPKKAEKRIMYTWTAEQLDNRSKKYLCSLHKAHTLNTKHSTLCLFHGSPDDPDEFLFPQTPASRFRELSSLCPCPVIIVGHSHTPFHKLVGHTHFINPGSVGRMFDSNPAASCAILHLGRDKIRIKHYRIDYPVKQTVEALAKYKLPAIYQTMYLLGRKLN